MTSETVPKVLIDELPMPTARDEAWNILGEHRVVEVEDGYAATDREVVETVLKNPSIFSSKKAFDAVGSPVPLVPIATDPPDHTRYRRILLPMFSPRAINPLQNELRRQIIEIIEPIAARGECEFMAEVGGVFPIQVFLTVFGLPLDMRDQFMTWKDALLALSATGLQVDDTDDAAQQRAAALEVFMYMSDLIRQRRGVPGDDMLSQVLNIPPPDALTDEEAIGMCIFFVLAGLDTVMDALGFGMQRLAQNSDKRREIVEDPSLIPAATEELLRLDPPTPFLPRVTTEDTTLGGVSFPAGTRIANCLAVANRDERLYKDPGGLDFHRPANRHTTFGLGAHRCLGSHLARLEMHLVYEEWHKRIPSYHITPGTTPQVRWPCGTAGLESLHLSFGNQVAR